VLNAGVAMIRVFCRRTSWTPRDDLAFVGPPPLYLPPKQPVRISATFSWDIPTARHLAEMWAAYYPDVQLGGPAMGDPGKEFVPGRFVKEGVVFTSRGCIRRCPWCLVPEREGPIRELPVRDGWIVADNNLLACSRGHIEAVFEMLGRQRRGAVFSGGLDIRLLAHWHIELLKQIPLKEIWVAYDAPMMLPYLERARDLLADFPVSKRRCYVLIGFDGDSLAEAERRLEGAYEMGFLPFAMLYQPPAEKRLRYTNDWRKLQRKWCRPAIYRRHEPRKEGCPFGRESKP